MNNIGQIIEANNFNQLFLEGINSIYTKGVWTKPRGFDCKEIMAATLILTNPKNCLITIKDRKLNYAYLIIEKMMYLSQICNVDTLIAYNNKMKDYLNLDTSDFDGAYGPRIAMNNQLEYCYNELKSDPDSRRAIVTIHNSSDCKPTKDSACTLSWHFMIRDNKLNMFANMRSNDILWGLCLDIPAFCFIQEVMAYWLRIEVGNYIHYDASLHYYKEFEQKLLNYIKNQHKDSIILENHNEVNNEKNPVWDIPYEETKEALEEFWKQEEDIRKNREFTQTKWNVINFYLIKLITYWAIKDKKNDKK